MQSKKGLNLKFTMQLCVVAMKNHAKFEEELPYHFKVDKFIPKHWTILRICTLMGYFWPKYMFELKKSIVELSLIALKIDAKFKGKLIWRIWQIFIYRLKNSDFILESKMAEINQNENSKQTDRPDTVWKLYFTFKINE